MKRPLPLRRGSQRKTDGYMRKSLGKADDMKTPSLFRGLVFCGDCSKALVRRHVYNRRQDGRIYYYNYLCVTSVKRPAPARPKT